MSLSPAQLSAQFEVLIPSDEQSNKSQQNFVTLEDQKQQSCLLNNQLIKNISYNIIDENTIIIVDPELNLSLSSQQWNDFIKKKQKQIILFIQNQSLRKNQPVSRLTVYQKNAILSLKSSDLDKRKFLWEMANYNQQVQRQYVHKQKEAEQMKENIITILSYDLTQNQITSLRKNAMKISKVLKQIGQYKDSNEDAFRIFRHEKEIIQWIYDTLMRYALNDQQIRYCKGIQYICLGIVVAYPEFNLPKYTQIFYHFMNIHKFRQLYLQGCPKYFAELHNIKQYLKNTNSKLYDKIAEFECDYKNLFISYFRSCLIYKIKNPQIIRKLFQLLFVEGISVIKSIILRIIEISTPLLLKNEMLIETLSSHLVLDYFNIQSQKDQYYINTRIQRLFSS